METERLRLSPIGPHLADELYRLHLDPGIARWYGEWTRADAEIRAAEIGRGWPSDLPRRLSLRSQLLSLPQREPRILSLTSVRRSSPTLSRNASWASAPKNSSVTTAGFDLNRPALVSWLGVTMHLTTEGISETLDEISGFAPGTELIVEHLAAAAEHGETFLDPEQMAALLRDHGLEPIDHVRQRETLSPAEWKRENALRPTELSVLTRARVTAPSPATDPTAAADTPTNTRPKPPAPRS